jgi:hypothetical protein
MSKNIITAIIIIIIIIIPVGAVLNMVRFIARLYSLSKLRPILGSGFETTGG